eukprot:jgi/Mesvir1/5565/Mv15587-RA.1
MAKQNERMLVLTLGAALFILATLTSIHYVQDISYWRVLEDTVVAERNARVLWQNHADVLTKNIAQLEAAATDVPPGGCPPANLSTAAVAAKDCPPCPEAKQAHADDDPCFAPEPKSGSQGGGGGGLPFLRGAGGVSLTAWLDRPFDFKVYVYDLPKEFHSELKSDQKRCITDQYGTEILIHEELLRHPVRTIDPKQADFFFVPIYGECYLFRETKVNAKLGLENTNRWFRKALNIITNDYPYWNRTQGRDHLWVFAGARGPHIFKDWKKYIRKSVFLTPEGDRSLSEQFNTWKDIVIPGLEADAYFTGGENRRKKKDIFAFFRGTIRNKGGASYSRGIRIKMEAVFKGMKDVIFTEPVPTCNRACYQDEMHRSTFCLCPRGWSPWTLRAYQAMMVGCIPVIIADDIEFPYEEWVDWSRLVVKIPEAKAEQAWPMVAYHQPAKKGDAFHAVLQEIGRKKRQFKASSFTFWER